MLATTDQIYDIIIIGASEEGISFCEQIVEKTENLNIGLVSRNFNRDINLPQINLINKEVIFSSYHRGLIGLTLADRTMLFGKNIIIATGTKPIKASFKNCNIQYNLNKINPAKTEPAVVFGNDNFAANYALQLAKKFKYVYLCTSEFDLKCEAKYIKKIENTANIVHLPNCNITGCKNNKEGRLAEVTLDTYSSIRCSALVMSLGRVPDNPGLSKRMYSVDSKGYIEVKEFGETLIVPNIYAIGTCTKSNTRCRLAPIINKIIEKNKFKLKEE